MTNVEVLREKLTTHFPGADILIEDTRGDDNHLALHITSPLFQGKTRIEKHQMIYGALQGFVGERLHALSIVANAP